MKQHKTLNILNDLNKLLDEATSSYKVLMTELDKHLDDDVYREYKKDIEKALANEDTQTLLDIQANIRNAEYTNNK